MQHLYAFMHGAVAPISDEVVGYRMVDVCPSYEAHMSIVRRPCVHRTTDDNYVGCGDDFKPGQPNMARAVN